jgi:hypothetical protein
MDSFLDSAEMASTDTRVLDKLKDALGRLPVPPEQRQHIHGCAQSLAIVAALFAIQDTPRARVGGSKKARAELELLVELAIDLNNHIQSLHGDTMAFIREQAAQITGDPPRRLADDPLQVADDLRRLATAADRAHTKVAGANEQLPGPRGWTHRAKAVTEKAARVYEWLTGRAVTISVRDGEDHGPFLDFLAEVFYACKVRASPESQARAFLRAKKYHQERTP